jgi:hypothetical protein
VQNVSTAYIYESGGWVDNNGAHPPQDWLVDASEWTRPLETCCRELARALVVPLLHPELWISRRAESVHFVDERTVRREMRVEFEVPPRCGA